MNVITAGHPVPLPARFSLLCVALLCTLPFLQPYHRNPLTAFYSEWLAFALGLGVMLVLAGRRAWTPAEMPWAALSPLALGLLVVLHGVLGWSPYLGAALTAALYLIWAALLIIAARALVRQCGADAVFDIIAAGIAAGALLSALIGCLQHLQLPTLLDRVVARTTTAAIFGNLAQANHFASYTTLGLLALAYLHVRGRIAAGVLVLAALPMLFVLGLSGSRAAALYLLSAFSIAAVLQWRGGDGHSRRLLLLCAGYLAAYFTLQLAVGAGLLRIEDRSPVTAFDRVFSATASLGDRIRLWQSAWQTFIDHPWTGSGWGTFAQSYFERSAALYPGRGYQLYHNAHNLPLHLLATTGLVGLLCAGLPLLPALRGGAPTAAPLPRRWFLLVAGAVLLLHSLLEYPLWYAYFLGIAALLLGVAPLRTRALGFSRSWQWLAVAMAGIGAVNLTALWLDYRRFETLFLPGATAIDRRQVPAIMMRVHQNLLLRPYAEVAMALPMALDENSLDRQLFINGRAMRFVPEESLVYRQVLLLALADRLSDAQLLLARARHAYPQPPAAFERDFQRLLQAQPERFRPLLESAPHRAPAHP